MLILILIIHFGKNASCGIPILTWTIVYFVILGVRSIANFLKIFVIRFWVQHLNRYSLWSFIIVDGTFLGWLIYGNFIFYSDANDCSSYSSSSVLYNLMLVLIIIGYFQMLVYGLLIFCLPCIIYAIHRQ